MGLVTVALLPPLVPCWFGIQVARYMEAVDFEKSAQLDLLVVPQAELHHILDVRSLRAEALASHHFLVLARFARDLIARTFSTRTAKRTKDRTSLKEAQHSNAFAALFQEYAEQAAQGKRGDINIISTSTTEAFDYA